MFCKDFSPQDFTHFLDNAPTAWHAVAHLAALFSEAGFTQLFEEKPWELQAGKSYFIIRNGSTLAAFRLPADVPSYAMILASHTDSPALKLKPNAEYAVNNQIMLGVEVYGAPLLSSWLNRDLGIAGRIVTYDPTGERIIEKLICLSHQPLIIPQLAIHLDREVNEKGLVLNKQDHLAALAALTDDAYEEGSYLNNLLKEHLQDMPLLGAELYLYPLQPASLIGNNQELISSYRLDNLASVYASYKALLDSSQHPGAIQTAVFWDNEEIGSQTGQGAASPFLEEILERVTHHLALSRDQFFAFKARSFAASIDLTHAANANYLSKYESHHLAHLGEGVTLKTHAGQRYATDALSAALITHLCKKNEIPLQHFVNRSDIPSGSTVGPIHATATGIKTVDIAIPQLSMHSSREIIASKDLQSLIHLLQALLETTPSFS